MSLSTGSQRLSDNAASLWRGDSLGGLRLEAASGERGAAGGIAGGGRDLYGIVAAYYAVRREEGLGMGDVKMLAMIGAFLGWKAVLVTLILSSFAGALVGIGIIAVSRGNMRLALPFGTFLSLGALAAMLVGEPLVAWYSVFFVP